MKGQWRLKCFLKLLTAVEKCHYDWINWGKKQKNQTYFPFIKCFTCGRIVQTHMLNIVRL